MAPHELATRGGILAPRSELIPNRERAGSASVSAPPLAQSGLRLPGWRRRWRGHPARELPGLRRRHFPPPRGAVSVPTCDLRTRVLNFDLAIPLLLAPVGYSRLMYPEGEIAAARCAGQAGTAYILSTISGHRLEDVKTASAGPVWFQLYLMGGRAAAEGSIARAKQAGFSALVVTIDTAVAGMRERDSRNGMKELMGGGILSKIPFLGQFLSRPAWLIRFLLDGGVRICPTLYSPARAPCP